MQAHATLCRSLREQRDRLARLVPRTRRRASEADVHRLRVLTRRLRAVLRVARDAGSRPARRAARLLRRLGAALGERRLWDVAIAGLVALGADASRFEPRRRAADRTLARALAALDLDALLDALEAAARDLDEAPAKHAAARAARLCAALEACGGRLPRAVEARHALRVRLKKARYLLEACGHEAPAARSLQALLGREHDLQGLLAIVGPARRLRALQRAARRASEDAAAGALAATVADLRELQRALRRRG